MTPTPEQAVAMMDRVRRTRAAERDARLRAALQRTRAAQVLLAVAEGRRNWVATGQALAELERAAAEFSPELQGECASQSKPWRRITKPRKF